MKSDVCIEKAVFPYKTALKLKTITDKNFKEKYKLKFERYIDEISGIIKLKKRRNGGIYEIKLDKISKGNGSETDFINSEYTFHTHPSEAYIEYNCELGWPSSDDFMAFLDGFLNDRCIFHCVITLEGIYIININSTDITKLCKYYSNLKKDKKDDMIKKLEKYHIKYINIDKTDFNMEKGVKTPIGGRHIHSVRDYVDYVNKDIPKFKYNKSFSCNLYNLRFIPWSNLLNKDNIITFDFFFPPNKNRICKVRK